MSPEVHTLTGAYALDALEPDERAEFERHLAECADCAAEVVELLATAARLGAAAAIAPPARLRDRVCQEIARTRQDSPLRLRLVGSSGTDLSARRRKRLLYASGVAAAVALLAAGVFAGLAVNSGEQLRSAQGQLDQEKAGYAPVAQLLAAPDVRSSSGSAGDGSATLLTSRALHKGLLVTQNLARKPAEETYQVWDISLSGFRSLGLLGDGGSATLAVPDLAGSDDIGITVEPAGGSTQPTSVPIMDFAVSN
ncbi:MAG TPA: anti-sigma factor [Pseudonocardiaceae bacterium]|nr:anti-sigma factor [Pseudonocardiaceae bacterium]